MSVSRSWFTTIKQYISFNSARAPSNGELLRNHTGGQNHTLVHLPNYGLNDVLMLTSLLVLTVEPCQNCPTFPASMVSSEKRVEETCPSYPCQAGSITATVLKPVTVKFITARIFSNQLFSYIPKKTR